MKQFELEKPCKPVDCNAVFGSIIPPIDRLKIISAGDFEAMVQEWAYGYIKNNYYDVVIVGGSGDKGRDVIAYIDEGKDKCDYFQCKRYATPLAPSNYWGEFSKLCYYTYIGAYKVPQKYYIVASQGVGQDLRDLIDNPTNINKGIISNWSKYGTKIITPKIKLTKALKAYIEKFDFSIVDDISPVKLLDQYSQTPWYKYRFGGGLSKKPRSKVPTSMDEDEKNMVYVGELINAYNEYTKGKIFDLDSLKKSEDLLEHFSIQRECFHSSQALKRFARDELLEEEQYNDIKKEIYISVRDTTKENHESKLQKINKTLDKARNLPLDINELGNIAPSDKNGICHELVNDKKLKWGN